MTETDPEPVHVLDESTPLGLDGEGRGGLVTRCGREVAGSIWTCSAWRVLEPRHRPGAGRPVCVDCSRALVRILAERAGVAPAVLTAPDTP